MKKLSIGLLAICLFLFGCGKPQIEQIEPESIVLAFGDSLTFGNGAKDNESYPSVLENQLGCRVINSGVSGEDTSQGLKRLPGALAKYRPNLVILCFGGNDMLRKQPTEQTISNLKKMIEMIKGEGADLIFIGVPKPGLDLNVPDFYEELADEYEIPYEGDILEKVLSDSNLKSDPIHPNAKGYRLIAEKVFALIKDSER